MVAMVLFLMTAGNRFTHSDLLVVTVSLVSEVIMW